MTDIYFNGRINEEKKGLIEYNLYFFLFSFSFVSLQKTTVKSIFIKHIFR